MVHEAAIRQWTYLEGFCNGASLITSLRRVPIFDGHNDVLLRLYRRGGTDGPGLANPCACAKKRQTQAVGESAFL
jgi:hypothetical protein